MHVLLLKCKSGLLFDYSIASLVLLSEWLGCYAKLLVYT